MQVVFCSAVAAHDNAQLHKGQCRIGSGSVTHKSQVTTCTPSPGLSLRSPVQFWTAVNAVIKLIMKKTVVVLEVVESTHAWASVIVSLGVKPMKICVASQRRCMASRRLGRP